MWRLRASSGSQSVLRNAHGPTPGPGCTRNSRRVRERNFGPISHATSHETLPRVMTSEPDTLRVKEIFENAIEITPTDDRQGYVNETCNGDTSLLARVQTLLRAHFENGGSFLPEKPAQVFAPPNAVGSEEKPGDVIGLPAVASAKARYKLLQKIGEGGCGVVWMAEQGEP